MSSLRSLARTAGSWYREGMLTRRDTLRLSAASWLLAGMPRALAEPVTGPRYFVTLFLRGGIDGVYTVDPKVRADVEANVDIPYTPDEIVDAGGLQFGPHFAKLKPWANKLAVVRGIQVHIANHESGAYQMLRMRTGVTANIPSLYEIIGQRREQPLASVTLGDLSSFDFTGGSLISPTGGGGTTALEAMDEMSDEQLAVLARSYQRHLKGLPSSSSLSEKQLQMKEHLTQVSSFFDRAKDIPRFKYEDWGGSRDTATDLQRTLWFIENDLTRGVHMKVVSDWDSHYRNAMKQTNSNASFVKVLSRFFDELSKRSNKHGNLADQTVVIVGSELGRFPVLNGNEGKDHFPETSLMFFGAGIRPGSYGVTGKRMEGTKTSLLTGKQDETGRRIELDDIGVTMMSLAGVSNPRTYGYRGERLKFLVG
jgi:hypothetical protein